MNKNDLKKRTPLLKKMTEESAAAVERISKKIKNNDTESICYSAEKQLGRDIGNVINSIKTEIYLYRAIQDKD